MGVNGCFTGSYTSYRLIYYVSAASAVTSNVYFNFRKSGTNNTGANYTYTRFVINALNGSAGSGVVGNTGWNFMVTDVSGGQGASMDLYNPYTTVTRKGGIVDAAGDDYTGTGLYREMGSLAMGSSTQFDGFSIAASSGTITGSIKIFAYN